MRRLALGLIVTAVCIAITVALFGRAYPLVDAGLRLTRADAIARARVLATRERLAALGARTATRFETNDTLSTYVDLAAGGPDSVRALNESGLVPVFTWAVRFFEPGQPRETVIRFAPDGRVVGVDRALAQDERRPYVSESAGRLAADSALAEWGGGALADARGPRWRLVSSSYRVVPRSERVERTYLYERIGARVGEAPVRAEVVVAGDSAAAPPLGSVPGVRGAALGVRLFAQIPEAFLRRYGEMRSANDLYADLTVPAMGIFLLAGLGALVKLRDRGLRWRPAGLVGVTVGGLLLVASLDAIPGAWFDYDTATSPTTFVAQLVLGAIGSGVGAGFFVATVLTAAEALTRRALPRHYDWWGYWRHRGAPPIARRILGGYALAAFGFAYVTLFYVTTRSLLGWWVPTGTLDDPNQIASPLPWVSALGIASFAGTWEEAIFRAVPLALLVLWAARRARPRPWITAGVVVTALVFGFGHANYPSWPAYSRGAELFLEAALWAVLFLRVGLPTTIIAHTLYDLTWFGLFSLHGTGTAYRVTFAIVLAALLLPAIAVAQGWLVRRRSLAAGLTVDEPPRFADWVPSHHDATPYAEPEATPVAVPARPITNRWRASAVVAIVAGLAAPLLWPRSEPLGPPFRVSLSRAGAVADSVLRARGGDPARWRRFITVESDGNGAERRYLEETLGHARAEAMLRALATTYLPASWWYVRYVRTEGAVSERAEQWVVRVLPDGRALDARHALAESAPGGAPSLDSARALAVHALPLGGVSAARLREVEAEQTPRPARLDTRVEYADTTVALRGGASARVRVTLAGTEPTVVTRHVRLPEAFQRAERERASRRTLGIAVAAIVALGLLVSLVVVALRRPMLMPGLFTRRRTLIGLGIAASLGSLAGWINALPSLLAAWPSEQPWTTYLATSTLSAFVGAAVTGVLAATLWGLTDALRRRTAILFWPAQARDVRDAALGGAALGIGAIGLQFAVLRSLRAPWPAIRDTVAADLAPWLHDAMAVVPAALTLPTAAALGLVLAVAVPRRAMRWGVLGTVLVIAALVAMPGASHPLSAAASVVIVGAGVALLAWWFGARAGVAWVFAALAVAGSAAARGVVTGETRDDVVASVLGLATAVVLAVVLYRVAVRRAEID